MGARDSTVLFSFTCLPRIKSRRPHLHRENIQGPDLLELPPVHSGHLPFSVNSSSPTLVIPTCPQERIKAEEEEKNILGRLNSSLSVLSLKNELLYSQKRNGGRPNRDNLYKPLTSGSQK